MTTQASTTSGIAKVQFYEVGKGLVGESTTSPYTIALKLSSLDNGTKNYYAKAFDKAGNSSTSQSIAVEVSIDDTGPSVSLEGEAVTVYNPTALFFTIRAGNDVIKRLQLLKDGTVVAEEIYNDAPAAITLKVSAEIYFSDNGTRVFRARAFDGNGNSTLSNAIDIDVKIVDDQPPQVQLQSPVNSFIVPGQITLTATAKDNYGITKVEFYRNGVKVGEDLSSPYTYLFSFTVADNGRNDFWAKVYDVGGNVTTSEAVTIVGEIPVPDTVPPAVIAHSDLSEATYPQSIHIYATVSDNKGVGKVELFDGTTNLGEPAISPSYGWNVPVVRADNGTKVFTIRATDTSGNTTISSPINVVVNIPLWMLQFGDSSDDNARAVASDAAGNVLAVGYGRNPPTYAVSAFLNKYDASAKLLWTKQIGTSSGILPNAVVSDTSSNVIVVGEVNGNLDGTSSGGTDIFIRKYDSSGALLWGRQIGSGYDDTQPFVAVDSNGNIAVVFSRPIGTDVGDLGVLVYKYSPNGQVLWNRTLNSVGYEDTAGGIAVDSSGSIAVVGTTSGTLEEPGTNHTNDVFIRKYDTNGNILWTHQFGTAYRDLGRSIAVDSKQNFWIAGMTNADLVGANQGNWDGFIRGYSATGDVLWTKQFGTVAAEEAQIAVDKDGYIAIVGIVYESIYQFADVYIRRFDSTGKELWYKRFTGTGGSYSSSVAVDQQNHIFWAGFTKGNLGRVNPGTGSTSDAVIGSVTSDGIQR